MVCVNLIPKHQQLQLRRRFHFRRWTYATMGVGLLLAIALADGWLSRAKADELSKQFNDVTVRLATLDSEIAALTLSAQQAGLKVERADALRSKRPWSGVLKLIDTCMPEDCWLVSFSTDPVQPSTSTSSISASAKKGEASMVSIETPRSLKLIGFASGSAQPYEFVSNLQERGVFKNVYLTHTQRQPFLGGTYFRFELECDW